MTRGNAGLRSHAGGLAHLLAVLPRLAPAPTDRLHSSGEKPLREGPGCGVGWGHAGRTEVYRGKP